MKKEERIVEILNDVSEKYIEEAAPVSKKKAQLSWIKWAGCAAAIVCVAGISWYSFHHFGGRDVVIPPVEPTPTPPAATAEPDTPQYHEDGRLMLTAGLNSADGMGFEGLMFYDISESGNANPWTKEAELENLPVYQNLSYVNGPGYAIWLDDEELLAKAEEAAEGLGTEIVSLEYVRIPEFDDFTVADRDKAHELIAMTQLGEIKVKGNGDIDIFFEPEIELPEKYKFTYNKTSDEEAEDVMDYLVEQYQTLHAMEEPITDSWKHYSFSGSPYRVYELFEGRGSLEEQILNYNFALMTFSPDVVYGKLSSISCGNLLDAAEKIGDYPIISWEEAQNLLMNGDYITTVPEDYLEDGVVKEEYIAKVELVYRTGRYDKMYMPYYRFYVELTGADGFNMAKDLKNFGAFYVPAVSGEYLTNFPVWGGEFN